MSDNKNKNEQLSQLSTNKEQEIIANISEMITRSTLSILAGTEFNGDRDYYEVLGYDKQDNISFDTYYAKYDRQDIASRIIKAPVAESWRQEPEITDDDNNEKQTKFEKAWEGILDRLHVYSYMKRADRLSRIGRYGILFIGVKGDSNAKDLKNEMPTLSGPDDVIYLRPYTEKNAKIKTWETDPTNPRFGKPKTYEINMAGALARENTELSAYKKQEVHWSRVIHIAENLEEDDVFGTPALKVVLNQLHNLMKVVGGGSEMFWRDAKHGLHFDVRDEYEDPSNNPEQKEKLENMIDEYYHGLRRYIKTKGMDVNKLMSDIANPKDHFEVIISLISAATNIPKRILVGSERGELASSQDEKNWLSYIEDRQTSHVEPIIIRAFIDRLQEYGALEQVEYEVKWENLFKLNEKDEATVVKTKAEAANELVTGAAGNVVDVIRVIEEDLGLPVNEELKKAIESGQIDIMAGGDEVDENDSNVQDGWDQMNNRDNEDLEDIDLTYPHSIHGRNA